jgi:arylsulfatase A-like enzyme
MPTVLDLMGLPVGDELDGKSFAHALRGQKENGGRPIFAMEYGEQRSTPFAMAVIEDEDWYIRHGTREELYDMGNDPAQNLNLASGSNKISRLRFLAKARERYRPSAPALTLDKELEKNLRTLGYLQ